MSADHPHRASAGALGVILAGGEGRRIGGGKAAIRLRGRPLISYPLAALRAALDQVVVLAKPKTLVPSLPGVTVWIEPAVPTHPLFGILHALELAEGRAVVVCAVDLPFVSPELVARLAATAGSPPLATIATAGGRAQPLLGRYAPQAVAPLGELLRGDPQVPLRDAVAALEPELLEVPPDSLENINAPEDLLRAGARLQDGRV